jgi:hypothetical protein
LLARTYSFVIESDDPVTPSDTPPDFPWPPRENDSLLDAVATTWKQSVFQPTSFFRRMPRESPLGWALGYYFIMGIIGAGLSLFWRMVFGGSILDRLYPDAGTDNAFIDFLLSPILLLAGLYIAAGIAHLFLLIFQGRKYPFGTTLRVFCFSEGPQLFYIVPFIGPAVGGIWTLVLWVIGLREAHETTTGKALASILVPMFLFMMLALILFFIGLLVGAATQLPV